MLPRFICWSTFNSIHLNLNTYIGWNSVVCTSRLLEIITLLFGDNHNDKQFLFDLKLVEGKGELDTIIVSLSVIE